MGKTPSLDRAKAFLERIPLVDAHNDLPYVIRMDRAADGDPVRYDLTRVHQDGDTDIPRLREGKLGGQMWAAFCPTDHPEPTRFTLELVTLIRSMIRHHAETFLPAFSSADVVEAHRQGRIAAFTAVENGVGMGDRLELLDIFRALNVRYMTLCHNETLDWIDSATDLPRHGGITRFGHRVIGRMNALGILIDVAHATEEAQRQVIAASRAPVAITHANARWLCDHPRNATEAVLRALSAARGIVMATFVPTFLNQQTRDWFKPLQVHGKTASGFDMDAAIRAQTQLVGSAPVATLEQVCDHLEAMTSVVGVDHVGIGSDFYGGPVPHGLEDVSRFPHLIAALMDRGWADDALVKLCSGNILRVLDAVDACAADLSQTA